MALSWKEQLAQFDLTPSEIASICEVSVSTAQRWVSGKNEPHDAMKPGILKTLIEDQNHEARP